MLIEIETDDILINAKTPDEEEKQLILTPKQEAFCRAYTQNDTTYSLGYLAFAYAYGHDLDACSKTPLIDEVSGLPIPKSSEYDRKHNMCSVSAYRLLRTAKIQKRCTELLNEALNDTNVDAELNRVIKQNKDLAPKVQAIKEYNALKGRIRKLSDVTSNGERIVVLPAEILVKYGLQDAETAGNTVISQGNSVQEHKELAENSTQPTI